MLGASSAVSVGLLQSIKVTLRYRNMYLLRLVPRAVTLHFRGLRPIGVSPYWLGDPGCGLYNSNELRANPVFLPIHRPLRRNEAAPLLWLRPLQGCTQRGPPTLPPPAPKSTQRLNQRLSWSFFPFDASARASLLHAGLPHRLRSVLRVSHPLDGLLLARTPGLVSCR
jgi:hypothetical protein